MKSLLNPFNLDKSHFGKVNNSFHDLQIDSIVRIAFVDAGKQKRLSDILSNICLDKETILYRQSVLRDMMYNRSLYYGLSRECFNLDKCFSDYNSIVSARLKTKSKTDVSLNDSSMTLRDYANSILSLVKIYRKLNEIFDNYGPSSKGLQDLSEKISKKVKSNDFKTLETKMQDILNSAFAFAYEVFLDDKLYPKDNKYILASGRYTGEKVSLFRRKEAQNGKIEVNQKVVDDFKSIGINAFNRVIAIVEDIFESLYDDISYISTEFIFFEFAVIVYDLLGERRVYCTFPEIGNKIEYQKAIDPYLVIKYINEGYSSPVYGNNITIDDKQSILVVGSNNTGKTVLLRTIGIFQVFAQNGLFLPCDLATFMIKDNVVTIFSGEEKDTDVGGRFEKEVIDIKDIIDSVDANSLVIINEIFQSTFASDGQKALFDILNYFQEIDVCWIDVTHLMGILDDRRSFIGKVKTYETTGESEKFKIKEI